MEMNDSTALLNGTAALPQLPSPSVTIHPAVDHLLDSVTRSLHLDSIIHDAAQQRIALVVTVLTLCITALLLLLLRLLRSASPSSRTVVITGPMSAGKTLLFFRLLQSTARPTVTSMKENSAVLPAPLSLRIVDVPGHPSQAHTLQSHLPAARGVLFVLTRESLTRKSSPGGAAGLLFELLSSAALQQSRRPLLLLLNRVEGEESGLDAVRRTLEEEVETRRKLRSGGLGGSGGMEDLSGEAEGAGTRPVGKQGKSFSMEDSVIPITMAECDIKSGALQPLTAWLEQVSKKSKVETSDAATAQPLPLPFKPSSARSLLSFPPPSSATDGSKTTQGRKGTAELDSIDQQLSAATMSMSINFMERDVQSLFCELSSAESSSARLECVRSIKNKLIGSVLNKRLVVALELDLLLLSLLSSLTDDDCSSDDELRLQLLTALSSLCCGYKEAADRLLQHEMMQLLITAMRSGRKQMLEAGVRALKQLLASASDSRRDEAAQVVFAHVDVVAGLVQAVRHWQSPLSELCSDVVVLLCASSLVQRLCVLQHGLLPVLLSALSGSKPLSSSSPPSSRFLCSLRILAALNQENLSLGAFLAFCCSIPPTASSSLRAFHPLSVAAASVLPLCSSALLLHSEPAVKLSASSLLLSCVQSVHRLQRQEWAEEERRQSLDLRLLKAELEQAKASELLRLHRDYHSSPIGKRGRGGSDKNGSRKQRPPAAAAAAAAGAEHQHGEHFAVEAWMAATLYKLEAASEQTGAALAACLGFLSSALPRALRVMVKLVESADAETLLPACCRLAEAAQDNVELHEEISESLPTVLALLSGMAAGAADSTACLPSPPLSFSPLLPPALLRLLAILVTSQDSNRLLVLLDPAYCSVLQSCLLPSSSPALLVPALETVARLASSYRFHLSVFARSQSAAFVSCLLSLLPHADAAVSTACTLAVNALLAQHTAMRPPLLQNAETAEALLRLLSAYARCHEGQRRRQEYAIRAMSSIACRSSASLHQAVLDGMGGWAGTLSLLKANHDKQDADGLQAAVLSLVRRLLSPSREERVEDWTQPPRDDQKERDEQQAERSTPLPAAQLEDIVAAISPLFTAPASASSASHAAAVMPDSLLCLLLTLSALAECRSSLLLSNCDCLSFLLSSLRSAATVRREMSAATLSNALLLLNAEAMTEAQRQHAAGAKRVVAGRQRQDSSNGLRRKGSKRRRSVARWEGRAAGRSTRRRAESDQANGQTVARQDEEDGETKDEETVEAESGRGDERAGGVASCLTRLSTVGIVAQLLSLSRQEEDGAVQNRVRETLFLLRKLARSVAPSSFSSSSAAASVSSCPVAPLLQQLSSLPDRDVDPTDKQRAEAMDAEADAADSESMLASPQMLSSRRELGRLSPWSRAMDPLLWPSSSLPFLLDEVREARAEHSAAGRAEEVEEVDDSGEEEAEDINSEAEVGRAGSAAVEDSDDDDEDEELDSGFSFASARESLHSLHSLSSRFDHILFRMGPAASSAISSDGSRQAAQQPSEPTASGRGGHAFSDSLAASASAPLHPRAALLSSSRHPSSAAGNRELVALMRRGRHMRAIAEAMGVAASSGADRSSSDSQGDDDSMQS